MLRSAVRRPRILRALLRGCAGRAVGRAEGGTAAGGRQRPSAGLGLGNPMEKFAKGDGSLCASREPWTGASRRVRNHRAEGHKRPCPTAPLQRHPVPKPLNLLRPKTRRQLGLIFFFFFFLNYSFLLYISASVHHSHCRAIARAHTRTLYTEYTLYRQGCHQGVWYRTGYCGQGRPRLLAWPLPGWRRWETEQPPALPALSVPGKRRKGSGTSETPPPPPSPEAAQQGAGTAGERAQLPPRQR